MQAYADPESALDRAFERLYRRYVQDVYRYTLAVLRNPADAEDVTQTTFLNAYRAFKRGEEPLKPQHWLIKIAHNACRSRYVRTARRPVEVPFDESLVRASAPPEDAMDVRELLAALSELPFNQRAALVMRELDGRSYREIAETLAVTVPAVETLIFRARRRLRTDRAALNALGAVQLPPSLLSFFEGGGAVAGGGAVLGSGLALKAALMLAAGVVAGGVGYKSVTATASPSRLPHVTPLRAPERTAASPAGSLGALSQGPSVVGAAVRRGDLVARALPLSGRGASLPAGALHTGIVSTVSGTQGATAGPASAGAGPAQNGPTVASPAPPSSAPSASTSVSSDSSDLPLPVSTTVDTSALPQPSLPAAPVPLPSAPALPAVPEPVAALVPPPPPLPKVP